MKKPSGRSGRAISSIVASPSPVVTPGSGSADMVAELSWLNCSIADGATPVETLTTAESGTISPVTLRMKKLPSCSGFDRYSCGTCMMMS